MEGSEEEEEREEEVPPRPRKQATLGGGGRNRTPNRRPSPGLGRPVSGRRLRPHPGTNEGPPRGWAAGPRRRAEAAEVGSALTAARGPARGQSARVGQRCGAAGRERPWTPAPPALTWARPAAGRAAKAAGAGFGGDRREPVRWRRGAAEVAAAPGRRARGSGRGAGPALLWPRHWPPPPARLVPFVVVQLRNS